MRFTTFASSSSGNCALLELDGKRVLFDAGISCRRICAALAQSGLTPEALDAILLTHEHSDHIAGLAGVLKRCDAPIFTPRSVAAFLRRTMDVPAQRITAIAAGETLRLGALALRPFETPHDVEQSFGWRVEGSAVFALATDMGCVTDAVREGLCGADAALIEANHDVELLRAGRYPAHLKRRILSDHGHLSNDDCAHLARFLAENGTKRLLLGHLSRENNTPERAFAAVAPAIAGLGAMLSVAPAAERMTIELEKERACLL